MSYKYPYEIDEINLNKNFNMLLFEFDDTYIVHELYDFAMEEENFGTVHCGDWYYVETLLGQNKFMLTADHGGYFVLEENNFIMFEEENKAKAKEISLRLLKYCEG